jgi:hypothetical protein
VVNAINSGGVQTVATAAQFILNGTIEGPNVTADGRLGVGVVNPTRALEVAGDLVVSGTVSGGAGMGMFRNRIINGDMRVFQRGTTFSLSGTSATYTLDRWLQYTASGTTRTVSNVLDVPLRSGFISSANVVATAATTTTEFWLKQLIEMYNVVDLIGNPVTLSFWYKSNRVGNHGVRFGLQNLPGANPTDTYQTFTVNNANTWEYKVLTFTGLVQATAPTSTTAWNDWGISLNIGPVVYNMGSTSIANGDYFTLTGVQLEKGTVATPFEQRPYGVELQLCQRYYVRFTGDGSYKPIGVATAISTTAATGIIVAPTSMRTQVQTIDISSSSNTCGYTSSMIQGTTTYTTNDVYLYSAGTNFGFTTIGGTGNGMASLSWNLIGINLTNGSGITAGWSGMYYIPQGKYIGFSAEL